MIVRAWLLFFSLLLVFSGFAAPAAADDYKGPSGYGTTGTTYELDVSHDGYGTAGDASQPAGPPTYVVVEAEEGATEELDGETVIVVQEPQPKAATSKAPPPPKVVVVEEQVPACPGGVWVDGYWYYGNGQYTWVDGHCVVVRVNYVFVHPRWDFYTGVWWFVPGYYRPCGAYVGFGYYRPWYWYPPYYQPYYRAGPPVPVRRSTSRRPTTVYATPASRTTTVDRSSRHPTTVIHRAPSGAARATAVGRAGAGPNLTDTVPRFRTQTGIVSHPRVNTRGTGTVRRPSSTTSRGFSISRSRSRPSQTGTVRQPSSGSSRGRSGGRTRSAPSSGSRGGRGSSSSPSRGSGGSRSAPSPRSR